MSADVNVDPEPAAVEEFADDDKVDVLIGTERAGSPPSHTLLTITSRLHNDDSSPRPGTTSAADEPVDDCRVDVVLRTAVRWRCISVVAHLADLRLTSP